jgi:hypothetical protein
MTRIKKSQHSAFSTQHSAISVQPLGEQGEFRERKIPPLLRIIHFVNDPAPVEMAGLQRGSVWVTVRVGGQECPPYIPEMGRGEIFVDLELAGWRF